MIGKQTPFLFLTFPVNPVCPDVIGPGELFRTLLNERFCAVEFHIDDLDALVRVKSMLSDDDSTLFV